MTVNWIAFPLHPETPKEGKTLEALFSGQPVDIPKMLARLKDVASQLNLPFGDRTTTFNSRAAQELGKWAERQGRGDQFHQKVFEAYFANGINIAKSSHLVEISKSAGLDPKEAETVIKERGFKDDVDADWHLSRQAGITAVPTFVMGGDRLVGAQPYKALEALLISHGIARQ